MSQSPLARQSRKSLSAFSRIPSQLKESTSSRDLDPDTQDSPTPSSSRNTPTASSLVHTPSQYQNAFAAAPNAFTTPVREDTPVRRMRARHTMGGPETPRTPTRIIYSPSPYATPPTGLSRSSSIPFDMAASNRAARAADEMRAARALVPEPPREKRKRFVRTKPIWQRVIEWPGSLVDSAMLAIPTSVEEMLPPAHFANPIALVLYVIQWFLLAPLRAPAAAEDDSIIRRGGFRSGVDDRWGRYEQEMKASRRGIVGTRTAISISIVLLALATANAIWLFTRHRTYDLLMRSGSDPVASPNASPIPAPKVSAEQTMTDENNDFKPKIMRTASPLQRYSRMVGRFLWLLLRWAARSTLSAFGARPPASASGFRFDDRIQSLRVWDPPEFCLAFFCAFPPSAPIIAYLLTTSNPFLAPLLHAVTAFLLTHLAASFSQLVKDRQLLNAEVMREYDRRFVYRKVFAPAVDRMVDATTGPY